MRVRWNCRTMCADASGMGLEVLYPERMGVGGLVRAMSEQAVVVGPIGSAFHVAALCPKPPRMIVLSTTPSVAACGKRVADLAGCLAFQELQLAALTRGPPPGL